MQPDFVAGHSLGEYSALVAAGSLKFSDAVQLVRKRGKYMQEAVPAGEGAMAAILGLSPAVVADACKRAAEGEVCSPANLNSPDQTVISGHADAVKRAVEIASQAGAKRAVILASFRAVSLRADDARAGKAREGSGKNRIRRFERSRWSPTSTPTP